MTDEEKKIEEEIYERLIKKCDGCEFCKFCKFAKDRMEYSAGCWGKEAIQLIIGARTKQETTNFTAMVDSALTDQVQQLEIRLAEAVHRAEVAERALYNALELTKNKPTK